MSKLSSESEAADERRRQIEQVDTWRQVMAAHRGRHDSGTAAAGKQTLIVRITIDNNGGLSKADLADALRFRLDIGNLSASDVADPSAVEIGSLSILSVEERS